MADYYLKTDNIMKNMFTVALKDELAAQSRMGTVHPETEAMLQKVRAYELSEKRLPIISEEQRELRNALNRLRDKYLAIIFFVMVWLICIVFQDAKHSQASAILRIHT